MSAGIYHTHAASWIIMIILFLVSFFISRPKVTHMILRLFYLIMIFTGGYMLIQGSLPGAFHLKALAAIILIGMMEMILVRKKKGKSTLPFWIVFIILLALVLLIGYGVITF